MRGTNLDEVSEANGPTLQVTSNPVSLNCWILLVCFGEQCFVMFCEANRCGEVKSYLTNLTTCSLAQLSEKWWERNLATKSTFLKATHPHNPRLSAGLRNVRFKMGYKMVYGCLWDEDHRWLHLVALNSSTHYWRKKSRYCRDLQRYRIKMYKMRLRCIAALHDILGSSAG